MHPNLVLRRLAANLQPLDTEVDAARDHFRAIRMRLANTLGLPRIIPIGSHARGTAIRRYSDIDFLVVLPRKQARWGGDLIGPQTFLRKVADDLRDRFPHTNITRDGQAVVVNFRQGAHAVDVVPGVFLGMNSGRPLYAIPGIDDRWIETSPETHDKIFDAANRRSGGKLGALARLIKGWRFGRQPAIPLASFYTDLLLATTDIGAGITPYSECLCDFFREVVNRDARGLRDPAQIAGVISAASTAPARERLVDAAAYALDHAIAAIAAEKKGNLAEANRQWGIVFNRSL